jgi:hypothetical protein
MAFRVCDRSFVRRTDGINDGYRVSAVADREIGKNPCDRSGASNARRVFGFVARERERVTAARIGLRPGRLVRIVLVKDCHALRLGVKSNGVARSVTHV